MPNSSHDWLTWTEVEALLQARRDARSFKSAHRRAGPPRGHRSTTTNPATIAQKRVEQAARLRVYARDERNHRIQNALHSINPRHVSLTRSALRRSDALRSMDQGFIDQLELDDGPQTLRNVIRDEMRAAGLL